MRAACYQLMQILGPTGRILLIPVVLTTIVSLLRLSGEMQGWITTESGGAGYWLGISWLVPVFGLWFGWKLAPIDPPRSVGGALLAFLVLAAVAFGVMIANFRFVEAGHYSLTTAFLIGAVTWTACALLAARGWARLWRLLLTYALWARLPVIAITIAVALRGLDTHYDKIGPDQANLTAELTATQRILAASAAQLFVWIPFTILTGGLFASLGALFAPRRTAA